MNKTNFQLTVICSRLTEFLFTFPAVSSLIPISVLIHDEQMQICILLVVVLIPYLAITRKLSIRNLLLSMRNATREGGLRKEKKIEYAMERATSAIKLLHCFATSSSGTNSLVAVGCYYTTLIPVQSVFIDNVRRVGVHTGVRRLRV